MQDAKKIFKEYLEKNGLRHTPERDIILDEVCAKDEHFDIDSLFIRLRKKYPNKRISKASIYRTIPLLVKAGLVREAVKGKRTMYENVVGNSHHDHMSCVKCGRIIEFYDDKIDNVQDKICAKNDFEVLWHTHVVYGVCSKCKKD